MDHQLVIGNNSESDVNIKRKNLKRENKVKDVKNMV